MEKQKYGCVVSGSFDPITLGHIDIIRRAVKLFGSVAILLPMETGKLNSVLTYDERVKVIQHELKQKGDIKNYVIKPIEGTVVETAFKMGIKTIVRGLRNGTDLIYEMDMDCVNRDLSNSNVETVFLPCNPQLAHVSSSMVRELWKIGKYDFSGRHCGYYAPYLALKKKMNIVGITGGVACGKSRVQKMFANKGWKTIDLDDISKKVWQMYSEEIYTRMDKFSDFSIGSKHDVAELVMKNKQANKELCDFMHPIIKEWYYEDILRNCKPGDKVAVQNPLLFEADMKIDYTNVLCIASKYQTQMDRLVNNRGFDEMEARRRIAAQMPLCDKKSMSDMVINNDGTIKELEEQVDATEFLLKHN